MTSTNISDTREVTQRGGHRRSRAHWLLRSLALVAAVSTAACSSVGPGQLVSSHEGYNDVVQLTVTREVLKNIVRIRYADPIQFIAVSTINAQFSVNVGGSTGVSGLGKSGATGSVGGTVGYSDSPTITFVPQSDASFNKSIDSPIELREALAYAYSWGSSPASDLGLVVGSINDASDRAGPQGERYREKVNALVRLFEGGATLRYFREFYSRHAPIPLSEVGGLAYVLAAERDFYLRDAGDGRVEIMSKHLAVGLVVPEPHEAEVAADLRTLDLDPGRKLYPIRPPSEADPDTDRSASNAIWMSPRSVEGMMELAAMRVDVPAEHASSGIAPGSGALERLTVELPLQIRSAHSQPNARYRIQHRGYWFYIDDTDASSKRLFATLVQAYSSRIGSMSATSNAPQIVLPAGG
jgi:hypothetical protein